MNFFLKNKCASWANSVIEFSIWPSIIGSNQQSVIQPDDFPLAAKNSQRRNQLILGPDHYA